MTDVALTAIAALVLSGAYWIASIIATFTGRENEIIYCNQYRAIGWAIVSALFFIASRLP